jgi:hypothetical protein
MCSAQRGDQVRAGHDPHLHNDGASRQTVSHWCSVQAQGKAQAASDIDLLAMGSVSFVAVVDHSIPATLRLDRQINPAVMTNAAFQSKLQQGESNRSF